MYAPRLPWLLALVLASCRVETQYAPRTPHVLALGIKDSQLAVYKDGALLSVDEARSAIQCPAAGPDLARTADYQRAANGYVVAGGLFGAAAILVFPLIAVDFALLSVADDRRDGAKAALVDAVNRHNDTAECLR